MTANDDFFDSPTGTGHPPVTYRCVCGTVIPLPAGGGGSCPQCGRHYDSAVFRDAAGETLFMPPDSDPEAKATHRDSATAGDEFLGRKLEHFQVLQRIGGGGMGAVYRALDDSLQRYVALKVIRPLRSGTHEPDVEQIFNEARAQARVNHPHVAHIYYVGRAGDTPFLAMELVGTQTIAHRLKDGPLPFGAVVRFALQIARALEHAAKFDIVHGDVKPGNVLLADERTIKISDFGLARRLSGLTDEPGGTAGTPNYMAPEVSTGRPADHCSDLYSLGVTLFEMTFGRLPYSSDSSEVSERLRLHREAAVEFPDPWPKELPFAWRTVLERLLAKDREQRYGGFAELIADLHPLQPISRPAARPLPRGLAWVFDGFLLLGPALICALLILLTDYRSLKLLGAALQAGIALAAAYIQASWGTTPGKHVMQIRIVDLHGLPPRKSVLALRSGFQFLWLWNLSVYNALAALGLTGFGGLILLLAFLFLLAELVVLVFGKGRSLHDRFLRTRVVLDA